jgi:hypothetical protein
VMGMWIYIRLSGKNRPTTMGTLWLREWIASRKRQKLKKT